MKIMCPQCRAKVDVVFTGGVEGGYAIYGYHATKPHKFLCIMASAVIKNPTAEMDAYMALQEIAK